MKALPPIDILAMHLCSERLERCTLDFYIFGIKVCSQYAENLDITFVSFKGKCMATLARHSALSGEGWAEKLAELKEGDFGHVGFAEWRPKKNVEIIASLVLGNSYEQTD